MQYRGLYHPMVLKQAGFYARGPIKNLNEFRFGQMDKEAIWPLIGTLGRGALWLGGKALSGLGALTGLGSMASAGTKMMQPRVTALANAASQEAKNKQIANWLVSRHGATADQAAQIVQRAQAATTSGQRVMPAIHNAIGEAGKFGVGKPGQQSGQAWHQYLTATQPGPNWLERNSTALNLGLMGGMVGLPFIGGSGEAAPPSGIPEKQGGYRPILRFPARKKTAAAILQAKPHLWQVPAAGMVAGGLLGAMNDNPVAGALGGLSAGLGGVAARGVMKQHMPALERKLLAERALVDQAVTPNRAAILNNLINHAHRAPMAAGISGGLLAGTAGLAAGKQMTRQDKHAAARLPTPMSASAKSNLRQKILQKSRNGAITLPNVDGATIAKQQVKNIRQRGLPAEATQPAPTVTPTITTVEAPTRTWVENPSAATAAAPPANYSPGFLLGAGGAAGMGGLTAGYLLSQLGENKRPEVAASPFYAKKPSSAS